VNLGEARRALNDGDDVVDVLWRVWHLLDGADAHAMTAFKVGRATNATWRDPVANFEIERHGNRGGEIQSWRVDLACGTAECVGERPLRTPANWSNEDILVLAVELAKIIQAGQDDERLRWGTCRNEVKVLSDAALGGATSSQARRLRGGIQKELGGSWIRDRGLFVRVIKRQFLSTRAAHRSRASPAGGSARRTSEPGRHTRVEGCASRPTSVRHSRSG
jgi:hypothetical protein